MKKISEVKPGMIASIEGYVDEMSPSREITTKFGQRIKIANAIISDESAKIKLTLWNEDIDRVAIGDRIVVENGWVSEFKGELQITAGKQGKIIVNGVEKQEHDIEEMEE